MAPKSLSTPRGTRSRGGFTLVEVVVTIVVLSVLAGLAFVGYQANVNKSVDSSGEAELGQLSKLALETWIVDRDWTTAVEDAAADMAKNVDGFSFSVVADGNTGTGPSDTYGEVSWYENPQGIVGFAMLNSRDMCVMSRIVDRDITVWTNTTPIGDRCAGRFAVPGEQTTDATTWEDPNEIDVPAAATCSSSGGVGGQVSLSWSAAPGAVSYAVMRDQQEVDTVTGTSYTDTGLTGNLTPEYKIVARNADGYSSDPTTCWRSGVSGMHVTTAPDAVTGLSATKDGTNVSLTWNAHNPSDGITYTVVREDLTNPALRYGAGATNRLVDFGSAGRSASSDVDVVARLSQSNWAGASNDMVVSNLNGNTGWGLSIHNGALRFHAGATMLTSTATVPFTNGSYAWVRASYTANTGAGQRSVVFATSTDGLNWTDLGTPLTGAALSLQPSTADYTIGYRADGTGGDSTTGRIVSVDAFEGVGGQQFIDFDARDLSATTLTGVNRFGHTFRPFSVDPLTGQQDPAGFLILSGATSTPLTATTSTSRTDTIAGSTQNTEVRYTIYATNAAGNGPVSEPTRLTFGFNGTTTISAPSAADRSVALTWTAVDGASAYELQVAPDAGGAAGTWKTYGSYAETGYSPSDQNATVAGLINDEAYWFRIRPRSSATVGAWSAPVTATPYRSLDAPQCMTVVVLGDPAIDPACPSGIESHSGDLTGILSDPDDINSPAVPELIVDWDPPASVDVDNPVNSYEVRLWRTGTARPANPTAVVAAPATQIYFDSLNGNPLIADVSYTAETIAVYRSQRSPVATATGIPRLPIPAPIVVTSEPFGVTPSGSPVSAPGADIGWVNAPGSPSNIDNYHLVCFRSSNDAVVYNQVTDSIVRNASIGGLTPGVAYYCRAGARANGMWSSIPPKAAPSLDDLGDPGPEFVAWGPPGAPAVSVTERSSALGISWNAATTAANGRPITSFDVKCTSSNGGQNVAQFRVGSTGGSMQVVVTATPQKNYTCSVRANNGASGPWGSDTGTPYRTPYNLQAPNVNYNTASPYTVTANWAGKVAAMNNGGRAVDAYKVTCSSPQGGSWDAVTNMNTSYTTGSVTWSKTVQCRWAAHNVAGWSSWSPLGSTTTPAPPAPGPCQPGWTGNWDLCGSDPDPEVDACPGGDRSGNPNDGTCDPCETGTNPAPCPGPVETPPLIPPPAPTPGPNCGTATLPAGMDCCIGYGAPDADYSGNRYDGTCDDICPPPGDRSGSTHDGRCNPPATPPSGGGGGGGGGGGEWCAKGKRKPPATNVNYVEVCGFGSKSSAQTYANGAFKLGTITIRQRHSGGGSGGDNPICVGSDCDNVWV